LSKLFSWISRSKKRLIDSYTRPYWRSKISSVRVRNSGFSRVNGYDYGVWRHFQQYYSYIVTVSFIGGGNRSTRRKPSICRKSLTNFIT